MSDHMQAVHNTLEEAKNNIKGLEAQLNATKQMFNESMASNLQLRSSNILFQQNLQELHKELNELKAKLSESEASKNVGQENAA